MQRQLQRQQKQQLYKQNFINGVTSNDVSGSNS